MLNNKQLTISLPCKLRTLPALVLLSLFCSSALADRPAMEERTEAINTQAEIQDEKNQPEGPSSVELMMQHQARQQTGDVLQMQPREIQPGQTLTIQVLDIPRRGTSMAKVKRELGEPVSVSDSVGQPPITRWVYPDRVVYFEYSSVIHVVKR